MMQMPTDQTDITGISEKPVGIGSAVSNSNQRAMLRAEEAQKKES